MGKMKLKNKDIMTTFDGVTNPMGGNINSPY